MSASTGLAAAAEKDNAHRGYTVNRLAHAPVLDGRVAGNEAWDAIPASVGSFVLLGEGTPASKQTSFRAGHTDRALYFGIRCDEPQPGTVGALVRHSSPLWEQSSVELFLLPEGQDAHLHFVVNAESVQWEGVAKDGGAGRASNWKAAVHLGGDAWFVEIMLPWEALGRVPDEGEQWRLNVCRNIQVLRGVEHTSWAPVESSFHEAGRFATVTFVGAMSGEQRAAAERRVREARAQSEARPVADELLVYSRPMNGLYLQRGEDSERIGFVHGEHVQPRLSPEGKRVLYQSRQRGGLGVWMADVGTPGTRLCDGGQANWAPDEKRIVLARDGAVFVRDLQSGAERRASPAEAKDCCFPSFTGDGRVLFVHAGEHEGAYETAVVGADGTGYQSLLEHARMHSAPAMSPAGTAIALPVGSKLSLFTLETHSLRPLTTAGGVQSWPVWSRDGKSLVYCQSPQGVEGPWDLYHLDLARPDEVRLVTRDVEPGAHWRGKSPPTSTKSHLKGRALRAWQLSPGADLAAVGKEAKGWRSPPPAGRRVEGGFAVQNDWNLLCLEPETGRVSVRSLAGMRPTAGVALTFLDAAGEPRRVASMSVNGRREDRVALALTSAPAEGRGVEATVTTRRDSPTIGLMHTGRLGGIRLRVRCNFVVLPDRLGNDLIIQPGTSLPSPCLLPEAPFLLAATENGALWLSPESAGTSVWLRQTEQADAFAEIDIRAASGRLSLCPLGDPALLHRLKPTRAADGKAWEVQWPETFLAQWRLAVSSPTGRHAAMWDEEATSEIDGPAIRLPDVGSVPDAVILYAYGRSWHTPLDRRTPTDLLLDTMDVDEFAEFTDLTGVRGYRTGARHVALHSFLTSQRKRLWPRGRSPGWPESLDFEPILMLLSWVRMEKRPGVNDSTNHLCDDIVQSLAGLDGRLDEYATFAADLEALCGRTDVPSVAGRALVEETTRRLESLRESVGAVSVMPLGKVVDRVKTLRRLFGKGGDLGGHKEYGWFGDAARTALKGRQQVLAHYRAFAKSLRDEAGLTLPRDPAARNLCEDLRRRAGQALRNRYYLEGDWRGEKPL